MNNLQIVKSAQFGEVQCDVYSDSQDMFMTISQLSDCLGYADRKSIEKIIERNPYLKDKEFSVTDKLSATDGKDREKQEFSQKTAYMKLHFSQKLKKQKSSERG